MTKGAGALAMPLSDGIDRRGRPLAIAVSGRRQELELRERDLVDVLRQSVAETLVDFEV